MVAYTRAAAGGYVIDESTSVGRPQTPGRAERRPEARLPVDPVRRRRRRVGRRRAPHDVPALRHEDPPRERGGRGRDRCRCNRLARARRAGPRPLSAPVPLRQLRRGSRARLLRRHRRRRHVRPRRALRGLTGPPVGAGAGGVPDARAGRGVPLRRPARRRSPPSAARRPVRADRRLRRRRRRQPDHAHAAAQPEQPVPAGRPGRRRPPSGPHAAQRAACPRHRRRRPRRRHPLRRRARCWSPSPRSPASSCGCSRRRCSRPACRCWCCRRSPSCSGTCDPSDIRPITVADLLGRHPAEVDTAAIAGYVTGRRVLVTGAGGSIGAELCRQLHSFSPSALVMLDRDESGLHGTQLELEGRALLDSPSLVLADIRDRERIFQVFQQHRPEVVFHAAALKHLPLLEFNPVRGVEDQRRRHPSRARGRARRQGSAGSSTSAATRLPTRRACSATSSASASASPPRSPTAPACRTCRSASATCSARRGRCSACSNGRSATAGRSPSPIPT